jgi:hypothetical protein
MVLMAICCANYRFTLVDFGAYGRENDRSVYNSSKWKKQFETNSLGELFHSIININVVIIMTFHESNRTTST